MEASFLNAALRGYLDLLERETAPEAPVTRLAELLDRLALAQQHEPVGAPSETALEAPASDYQAYRQLASRRFPTFALYNDVEQLRRNVGVAKLVVADAIDDLADIACDLAEVRWRWDNIGDADAIWHFGFLYRAHWGRHLHSLRRYVHDVTCAA
jgi:hypothetical protein